MAKTVGKSGSHYDPADYCIPAQDHQGHSERLWCRVQPLIDRQVDVVQRSKNWPFRTKGDVMRWCIVRGLKVLEMMEPTINQKGFMQQAEVITRICREEMYQAEFLGMFEMLSKVIQQHISLGAQGEAVRLVAQVKNEIDLMSEPFWRDKCLGTLREKYRHLMAAGVLGEHAPGSNGNGQGTVLPPIPTPAAVSGTLKLLATATSEEEEDNYA